MIDIYDNINVFPKINSQYLLLYRKEKEKHIFTLNVIFIKDVLFV